MEFGHEYHLEFEKLYKKEKNIFSELKGFNCVYLDSGRSAINALSPLVEGGEVLMPCYACVSVIHGFSKAVKPAYYKVGYDFSIDFEDLESKITPKTKAIYIIHFFGKILPDSSLRKLKDIKEKYNLIIIEDTTHSIMTQLVTVGDYCLCSLRKWFPTPDGGVVYSRNTLEFIDVSALEVKYVTQKPYAMVLKTLYLREQVFEKPLYEKIFLETEDEFDETGKIYLMNDLTRFLIECCDIEEIKAARKRNHSVLRRMINHPQMVQVYDTIDDNCPFSFLLYVKNRDSVREYLLENGIRSSVFWFTNKTELKEFSVSNDIAEHILCIACDHRYEEKDMVYVAEKLNKYKG